MPSSRRLSVLFSMSRHDEGIVPYKGRGNVFAGVQNDVETGNTRKNKTVAAICFAAAVQIVKKLVF